MTDPLVRRATLAMAGVSTVALELALAEPGRPHWQCVATALGMLVAPAWAVAWHLGRRTRHEAVAEAPARARISAPADAPRPGTVLFLLTVFVLPFGGQLAHLAWQGRGAMLEVVLLAALRNLGLGLAALAYRPACARLGALISLFLVLVAASLGEGGLVVALVGAYAVTGTTWLMLAYWQGLSAGGAEGARSRLPWSAAVWVLVIAGACAVASVGPTRAATALAGLVPTSGGTEGNDPEARGGVNDGDDEVSASEDPRSVGFTDSEVYLDTDRPSLYDAFNEMYGEPYKPKKHERAIALGPSLVREQRERPAEDLRAGREFPLVRRRPDRPARRPGEREARALLYVKGPTPLHLPLTAYDRFDGRAWGEAPPRDVHCPLRAEGRGAWLELTRPVPPIYRGTVAHRIKIGTLDSGPLPVPAHLVRLRVGSVDRPDFFGWAQDGIIRMDGRTVPAGTVIETESRVVDPRLLAGLAPASPHHAAVRHVGAPGEYAATPAVSALGRSWVAGRPRGWGQVDAVVAALRGGYTLDRGATVPGDCADVVGEFLLGSRRGPDSQFASAAVVLLRSLGYSARLVGGLYADPSRQDVRTRHTPVLSQDVHFWAEVLLPGGTWVAIEPTPGYRLAVPSPTLGERLAGALAAARRLAAAHRVALCLWAIALAGALRYRREVLDGLATAAWWWGAIRPWRPYVLATLGLVEQRSRWAGCPRPPGLTPSRWYGAIARTVAAGSRDELERLVRLADWVLYAPEGVTCTTPWTEHEIRTTCRRVVRDWTVGRLRASGRTPSGER